MEIKVNDMQIQHDFDFALMDLKANRFVAAESKYEDLVKRTNHYGSWCGLGMAKMGLLLENRSTVDEIEYCFSKAKMNDTTNIEDIEMLYAKSVYDLIKAYYHLFEENAIKSKSLNTKMIVGIGSALAGGFVSGSSNSFTGKLMGLGIAGAGVLGATNAMHAQKDIRLFNQQLLDTAEKLFLSVKSFVTIPNPLIEQSEQSYLTAKAQVNDIILRSNERGGVYEKWYHNNLYLGLSLLIWPIFVYGLIMRYKK